MEVAIISLGTYLITKAAIGIMSFLFSLILNKILNKSVKKARKIYWNIKQYRQLKKEIKKGKQRDEQVQVPE